MKLQAIAALIVIGLHLVACEQKPEQPAGIKPSAISHEGKAGIYRVRLTEKTAAEYNIKTAPLYEVQAGQAGSATLQKAVPKSAVLFDFNGDTWIFTNPQPLVFIRQPVAVKSMDGDLAVLSEGPPVGTMVVTVGADKLLGLGSQ